MGIISIENLTKVYGDVPAVNDISFSVDQGEVFGFLGPNGAGKTSTINMMIGLSRPSGGKILIDGLDAVKKIKAVQKIIGVVPDENNLYDEMSGFDNLCFCGSLYGMRRAERERRAAELLELFNLTEAADRPFKAYSKGMKRKLTIAAGIIHRPKILFLDEPTTGVDVESARQIRELILDLKQQGTTIFITTHYLEEAERICDRIAFIVRGKIVRIGAVGELMEELRREYKVRLQTNGLIGNLKPELENSVPNCRVEIVDDKSCLIVSNEQIDLCPVLQLFAFRDITVYEAEVVKPTLEEVFINITNAAGKEFADGKVNQ